MACNLLNEDDTFFGFDTFPMMMIIYGMQSVQWGWYFFWVLEPHKWRWSFLTCSLLEQGEHFWDEIFSMMIILFLVLKPPQWGLIIYGMQSAQWWWYLFFWVLKPPEWRWSFLACSLLKKDEHFWHEILSMMMIFFGFWSPLNEDNHLWHAICSMIMIPFSLGFEAPSKKDDHVWHAVWFLRWDLFNDDDTFFLGFESPSKKDDYFGMQSAQWKSSPNTYFRENPFRTQSSEKSLSEHRFHRKPLPNTDFRELAKHSKKG